MTVTLSIFLLASIEFSPQDIPGLRVEAVHPLTGAPSMNCLQADINGDGASDLVFGREVAFQRGGRFPREARVPLPELEEQPGLDVWQGDIFLFLPAGLSVFRWRNEKWETILTQPLEWPTADAGGGVLPVRGHGRTALLQRRLHDLDADGVPEIVVVSPQGAHLFRRTGDHYVPAGVLEVLPQLTLLTGPTAQVWPPEMRRLVFPPREMACRLSIEGDRLRVLSRLDASDSTVRYRVIQYTVRQTPEGAFETTSTLPSEWMSADLPNYLQPCRLNADAMVDFAGEHSEIGRGGLLPGPVHTTCATLDGGASFAVRRSRTFRPHCSFVDFDGDGDLDMVTESNDLLSGGAREGALRFLTSPAIQHEISVYRQAQGVFAGSPALTCRFPITLDFPPFARSALFQRYQRALLVNLCGDFNGDGYKDLVVQDRPDRLVVFLAAGFDFPNIPDCRIPLELDATFAVADVNLDGRADVVLKAASAERGGDVCRVYFATEGPP